MKVAILLLLLLLGCDGHRFDYINNIDKTRGNIRSIEIEVGETSKISILKLLGEPKNYSSGKEYSYVCYSFDPVNYYTIVIRENSFKHVFFMGDTNKKYINLSFDKYDKLSSFSVN